MLPKSNLPCAVDINVLIGFLNELTLEVMFPRNIIGTSSIQRVYVENSAIWGQNEVIYRDS